MKTSSLSSKFIISIIRRTIVWLNNTNSQFTFDILINNIEEFTDTIGYQTIIK